MRETRDAERVQDFLLLSAAWHDPVDVGDRLPSLCLGVPLSFQNGDIRTQESELRTLVSASLDRTVDAGDTILTLLLPDIILPWGEAQPLMTLAIITKTFGILPRQGAQRTYQVLNLQGTARFVES